MKFRLLVVITGSILVFAINGCVVNQSKHKTVAKTNTSHTKPKPPKRDLQRNTVKPHRENTIVVSNLGGNGKVNNTNTPQVASQRINHRKITRLESKCSMKGQCARLIQNKIFDLWQYPKSYPKYKTILVLDLSNQGYITTIKLKRSSGIRAFDDSVIKAVRQAAPFTEITYLPALDITEFSSIEMVFRR